MQLLVEVERGQRAEEGPTPASGNPFWEFELGLLPRNGVWLGGDVHGGLKFEAYCKPVKLPCAVCYPATKPQVSLT
jgi:hypothetical protein